MFDLIFLSTLNSSDTSFYLRSQNTRNVLNHDTKEEIKFLSCKVIEPFTFHALNILSVIVPSDR